MFKFLNKGISTPIVIVIIILVAILVGGILAWQYLMIPKWEEISEVKPPKEIAPKDEIADWKTYRNEKYGFEVKYPINFEFDSVDYLDPDDLRKHNINPETVLNFDLVLEIKMTFVEIKETLEYPNSPFTKTAGPSYWIEVRKTNYSDINHWFENWRQKIEQPFIYEGAAELHPKITSAEDIIIDNRKAKKIIVEEMPYLDSKAAVINDNFIYMINYDGTIKASEWETLEEKEFKSVLSEFQDKYRVIFNQILSTFRFLE